MYVCMYVLIIRQSLSPQLLTSQYLTESQQGVTRISGRKTYVYTKFDDSLVIPQDEDTKEKRRKRKATVLRNEDRSCLLRQPGIPSKTIKKNKRNIDTPAYVSRPHTLLWLSLLQSAYVSSIRQHTPAGLIRCCGSASLSQHTSAAYANIRQQASYAAVAQPP